MFDRNKNIEEVLLELKSDIRMNFNLEYYRVYSDLLYCKFTILNRNFSRCPVLINKSIGKFNTIDIINESLKLLERVSSAEKTFGPIIIPKRDSQPYIGGYHRVMISDDIEVEFKRIRKDTFYSYGDFAITGISKKDKFGFYYLDTPQTIEQFSTDFAPITKGVDKMRMSVSESSYSLEDGEEIYMWDTISYLSGTSGLVIVKDGYVIKTKMVMIS